MTITLSEMQEAEMVKDTSMVVTPVTEKEEVTTDRKKRTSLVLLAPKLTWEVE